jgi:hypothetical protein
MLFCEGGFEGERGSCHVECEIERDWEGDRIGVVNSERFE